MGIPVFDLWTIFLVTIFDTIIDLIIFKFLRVQGITVIATILLNFVIPYLSFWAFIQSRPPLEEQIPALGDFIGNMLVNLVNFTISAFFGYLITAVIFIFSGGRTPEPEM
jgi:uncharacterized protein involved in cysteine biosynthesis